MARPYRVRFRSVCISLAILFLLTAAPAFPSGFQLNTQGARAMGMGLAFTAVANDPSAIFFNPAGLGWQKNFDVQFGSSFITKTEGDFSGADPFPGIGNSEKEHKTTFVLPTLYVVFPLTHEINLGFGTFSQYGLGFRWDNAEDCGGDCATNPVKSTSFSGRFIGQNAVIQSVDLNPVLSFQVIPSLTIAAGADYRVSKVQLEKNQGAINPVHELCRGCRARQAEQRTDGQRRLGMERGHPLPPEPAVLLRRRLPEQDRDRLRGHRHASSSG